MPLIKKNQLKAFFTLVLLFFSSCFAAAGYAEPTKASVVKLGEVAVYPVKSAFASVITLNNSKLSAEVSAKIKSISAEVGQIVNRGDVLIQLDATDYNLALQQAGANLIAAQSNLELSQKQLERAEKLVSDGFISPERLNLRESEFTNAKSKVTLRRAQYNAAKRNVAKCSVKAPFKSVIRERIAQVGEITAPGAPLLHLSDLSTIEIDAKVQPRHIDSLTLNRSIIFTSDGTEFPVRIKRIVPVVNEENRNQTVRLEFIKNHAAIGSAGTIKWAADKPHAPTDLLVQRNSQLGVFILNDNQAKFFVVPGASEGSPAMINLPLDTLMIYQGQHRLQDGQAVSIVSD